MEKAQKVIGSGTEAKRPRERERAVDGKRTRKGSIDDSEDHQAESAAILVPKYDPGHFVDGTVLLPTQQGLGPFTECGRVMVAMVALVIRGDLCAQITIITSAHHVTS